MGRKWRGVTWAIMMAWGIGECEQGAAQGTWAGDLDQWLIQGDSLALQASSPGTAFAWKCFNPPDQGWDVSLHWVQELAGSLNNFSTLHFFRTVPGLAGEEVILPTGGSPGGGAYGGGVFFRLGATGNQDPLEAFHVMGSEAVPTALGQWEHGTWATGLDQSFRLRVDPAGSGVAQWSSRPSGSVAPWQGLAQIPWEIGNHCIAFQAQFTSSNLSAFALALHEIGDFTPDTQGPRVLGWNWLEDTLLFQFDEPLSAETAPTIQWWTQDLTPGWGTEQDYLGGRLKSLPPNPPPGTWLELNLSGIADTLGNLGSDTTLMVCKMIPERAEWRDLVITEIMADPTPHIEGPEMEWVEILNRGEEGLDLRDILWWDVGGGLSSLSPFPGVEPWLFPGERAILSGEVLHFQGELKQFLVTEGMNLLDAGDEIGLRHPSNAAIDQVAYDGDWWRGAGGGVSIGIKFPGGCDGPSNWEPSRPGESPDTTPSTPGLPGLSEEGQSEAEETPLILEHFLPCSPDSGWFQFNQPLDHRSLPWVHSGDAADLSLHEAHAGRLHVTPLEHWDGEYINLKIRGVARCTPPQKAPWIPTEPYQWSGSVGHFPLAGDLALTEIAVVPPALAPEWGEYVEWTNRTNLPLETAGVLVNGEHIYTRSLLQPGEREVRTLFTGLPNEKGQILVTNVQGDTLERVFYGACWHADSRDETGGKSWVRGPNDPEFSESGSWMTSRDPRGGSPGDIDASEGIHDSHPPSMGEPPRLIYAGIREGNPIVLSNQPLRVVPPRWEASSPSSEDWIAGWGNGRFWEVPAEVWPAGDSIENYIGSRAPALEPPGWTEVLNRLLSGPSENPDETGVNGWTLNEVLSDPLSGGEPFVEIQWQGTGRGGFTGDLRWTSETIPQPSDWRSLGRDNWWIPAQEPVAWARCPSRLRPGLHLPAELPSLYGDRLLTLSSAPWLLKSDTLQLGDHRHSPWIWDAEGISLERLEESTFPTIHRRNDWFSCLNGSTPSKKNSQSVVAPALEKLLLTLSAQTLTPGPSGALKFLDIQLCMPAEPEFSLPSGPLEIGVYDLSGHLRYSIPQLQPILPAPGACERWTWDGRGPHGSYLPPGPYLIVVTSSANRPYAWSPIALTPVR